MRSFNDVDDVAMKYDEHERGDMMWRSYAMLLWTVMMTTMVIWIDDMNSCNPYFGYFFGAPRQVPDPIKTWNRLGAL